jgi:fatty acid desaturase
MDDSSILIFNLVFAGTLGIGFLMFLGQLAAFIVLLAITATVEFLVITLGALIRRTRKSAPQRQLRGRHFSRVSPATDASDG